MMYDFFKKSVDENDLEWKQFCMDQFVSFLVEEHEKRRLAIITALQTAVQARLFSNVHLIMDTFPDVRMTQDDLIVNAGNAEYLSLTQKIESRDLVLRENTTDDYFLQILLLLKVNRVSLKFFSLSYSEVKEIIPYSFSRLEITDSLIIYSNPYLKKISANAFFELALKRNLHIEDNPTLQMIVALTFNRLKVDRLCIEDNLILEKIAPMSFYGLEASFVRICKNFQLMSIPVEAFTGAFIQSQIDEAAGTIGNVNDDGSLNERAFSLPPLLNRDGSCIPRMKVSQNCKSRTILFKTQELGDIPRRFQNYVNFSRSNLKEMMMRRAYIIMLCLNRFSACHLKLLPAEILMHIFSFIAPHRTFLKEISSLPTQLYHSSLWENKVRDAQDVRILIDTLNTEHEIKENIAHTMCCIS